MTSVLLILLALQQAPADLIVTNARIYTSDVNRPVAVADRERFGHGTVHIRGVDPGAGDDQVGGRLLQREQD